MKRLTPNEIEAQDALQVAVIKTFALLEVTTLLRQKVNGEDFLSVDMITIEGLNMLAMECGKDLLCRFNDLIDEPEGKPKRARS